jgi:hypothetical protein
MCDGRHTVSKHCMKRKGECVRLRLKSKSVLFLIVLFILAATVAAKALIMPYLPDAAALQAMKGGGGITVTESEDWIVFERRPAKRTGVLLYPGESVRPESYAPLAQFLAQAGYRTWIVKMPFNYPLLGVDRANKVMDMYPGNTYVIGGHSLGGTMAATYASKYPGRVEGLFLLAANTDSNGNLAASQLPVLSLVGTLDEIIDRKAYEQNKQYLPERTQQEEISGGNHSQFGSYGKQKGDRPALITAEQQQYITADLMERWLRRIAGAAQPGTS